MEQIAVEDKVLLDKMKYNRDVSALQHENLLLKLAVKYGLVEGDTINEDTTISRKPKAAEASV